MDALQIEGAGLPRWLGQASRELAAADPAMFGLQSSDQVERVLRRKPGTLEQFVRDHQEAFR